LNKQWDKEEHLTIYYRVVNQICLGKQVVVWLATQVKNHNEEEIYKD